MVNEHDHENSSNKPAKPGSESLPPRRFGWYLFVYTLLALLLIWISRGIFATSGVETIPYSEFKSHVANKEVPECEIRDTEITGIIERADSNESSSEATTPEDEVDHADSTTATDEQLGKRFRFRTIRAEDPKLVEELEAAGTRFEVIRSSFTTQYLLYWILPLAFLLFLWILLSQRIATAGKGVMSIGKSRAKLVADRDTGVTFADVAGCDEAKYELQEVIDCLQHPDKYTLLGAKIPKGVLLLGPPGTGKTLLARAVAGEAGVPFFSLSGSEFVEMFVGVGAARVRDLFDQAKQNAPCIVFIDELDAIGRQRGVHMGVVNDERETTLNQLLVEMDGFDANVGVILLSATNRPEILDQALLRAGRFDRQVVIDSPDIDGREAILKVHSREKPLADDVNLRMIAQGTPGMSGADLANIMNEAALLSARRKAKAITQKDIEAAVEKIVAGPERKSRRLDEDEKRRIAYHECGHAVVAAYCEHADPIHKISIIPRGRNALGYTLQLPTGDQLLMTRSDLFDRLKGLLGGRAAEDVKFGEVSTGAENDLERATTMARQMVCMYGMSDKVGLAHCAHQNGVYLNRDLNLQQGRLDCSESTARLIDDEVKQILDQAYADARQILVEHQDALERVAQELLIRETLDAKSFNALLGREPAGQSTGK